MPKHPTLPDAEIAAVEEAMEWERPPAPKQPVVQVVEASPKQPALQTSPVDAEQREQRVAEHMKELQVLKYGPLEPEPKPRIPASLDLPNGIIL